jgi:CheY-like chemotaxis protein
MRRILIVDDNEVVLELLHEFLSRGYAVELATNASQAMNSLRLGVPDIILLDVMMPGTDGLTMLGVLRKSGIHVPTLIMTGYPSAEAEKLARDNGAAGFLSKPVSLRDLDRFLAQRFGTPRLVSD